MIENNKPEVTEWDLTPEEIMELREIWYRRIGVSRLLIELQKLEGYEVERNNSWWDAVNKRLNIPEKYRYQLIADHKIGKVWVKRGIP